MEGKQGNDGEQAGYCWAGGTEGTVGGWGEGVGIKVTGNARVELLNSEVGGRDAKAVGVVLREGGS